MEATRPADRLFDYDVVDAKGHKIGSVNNVWIDQETGAPMFLGAQAGWLVSHTFVLPAEKAAIDDGARMIRLPYDEELVKHAPALSKGDLLTDDDQQRIFNYYGTAPVVTGTAPAAGAAAAEAGAERAAANARNSAAAARSAEVDRSAQVDRRPIEAVDTGPASSQVMGEVAGDLRIRKVVRRERIYVPVDVDREYVEVAPAAGADANAGASGTVAPAGVGIPPPPPPPQVETSAQTNANETARNVDPDARRSENPRSI